MPEQPQLLEGAWRPTYVGIRCQPAASSVATQLGVRLPPRHAALAPPMYTPIARYGDEDHADMVWVDGASQPSNPRPVYTDAAWARGAAARARGAAAVWARGACPLPARVC